MSDIIELELVARGDFRTWESTGNTWENAPYTWVDNKPYSYLISTNISLAVEEKYLGTTDEDSIETNCGRLYTYDFSDYGGSWDSNPADTWESAGPIFCETKVGTGLRVEIDRTMYTQIDKKVQFVLGLTLQEDYKLKATKGINIDLVVDIFRTKKGEAVYSEVSIFNDRIQYSDFQDLVDAGSPAGFGEFNKFLPGDYTYRYAKVKLKLETFSGNTPIVDNLKVTVDVPDVHDKGLADIHIADDGYAVEYSRKYIVGLPSIVAAFKGGVEIGTPVITLETLRGFTVHLISNSTGLP